MSHTPAGCQKLDRHYQKVILSKLANAYPDTVSVSEFCNRHDEASEDIYIANMLYLEGHGLVKAGLSKSLSNRYTSVDPCITVKGLDFLADDGGLTAILGTVTIKFHDETLRALIASKIESSDLDQQEKSKLLTGLQELPAESIKHLTMRLLDKGLESLPSALPIIQTALQGIL